MSDPQFDQWQQAFKQATPAIDIPKLVTQVATARRLEQWKAWFELLLGVAVSIYCLYTLLSFADSPAEFWLFGILTPVPVTFGLWTFLLRRRQWQQQSLDVTGLLEFKRQKLHVQLRYWRVTSRVCIALYIGLCGVALSNYLYFGTQFIWLVQLGVNGAIVLAVLLRYQFIKTRLPKRLAEITKMQELSE